MLFVRVLGPIVVEVDGRVVDLGGQIPRRFLAALSTTAGTPVPDAVLAELVWGEDQPQQAVATMRVIASRLRSAVGPADRDCLQRSEFGYRLAVRPEWTDLSRFTDLIAHGTRLLTAADAEGAVRCFDPALALWRGLPWLDLADAQSLSAERARLMELRDVAVEELQAARLACGQTTVAVADLIEAVTATPFRERRWELLALGLYRSGRQAQALAELRRVRVAHSSGRASRCCWKAIASVRSAGCAPLGSSVRNAVICGVRAWPTWCWPGRSWCPRTTPMQLARRSPPSTER
ncbi:AfsR/SARP family transcriptional regulator [Nocardia iowensis]|uniref:Bacterial transcriptional activator domain-containing protein n=1 Tax=Nocardia iowensis TaxID=204891 RepID=A0ABX8RYK1_NOCIO|nr:BTAD domain-containing putative transcriptional regulator [Nocardia iowensis]QXN94281.1 hypothetical protein KV110_15205 [Nocardia iowensis]